MKPLTGWDELYGTNFLVDYNNYLFEEFMEMPRYSSLFELYPTTCPGNIQDTGASYGLSLDIDPSSTSDCFTEVTLENERKIKVRTDLAMECLIRIRFDYKNSLNQDKTTFTELNYINVYPDCGS